ncbi:MAG: SRPBCC family protein [Spirochaetaceae bacterium]|nr:SRPBCC family protein [Myxococcales bacterium]MCB9724001.1 SRPBCC family protein [Spirochaetaceae bacterium]
MTTIERSIEVDVPASTAYAAWTHFELFPHFMRDVEEVRQEDDRHLHWRARFWGRVEEWDALITEQIPDKRIAWRSEGGTENAGVVTFHRLSDDSARVMLQMAYQPETLAEKAADLLGVLGRRVEADLRGFKVFVERTGEDLTGWRGTIPAPRDAAERTAAGGSA